MLNGMDIGRLNFSHGTHDSHLDKLCKIRDLNKKYRRKVKVLQDLEGYRIRIGRLKAPIELKKKQIYYLVCPGQKAGSRYIPVDYTGRLSQINKTKFIYIDDGKIILKVIDTQKNKVKVRVAVAGVVYPHKGIQIPGFNPGFSGLTEKDRKDLEFAFKHKPEFIAQSFVRTADDVLVLRDSIESKLPSAKIIAKIENQQGVDNIDKIIDVADMVMVARGDLGVCLAYQKVPFVQKEIIAKCNKKSKPVIVATQMLESMTENFRPSRAEVSDITNAILEGATHLLLSSETASGKYPVESVNVMNEIIKYAESKR